MAAYWIGQHAITDAAGFDEYLRQVIPMIERHGGRYLTRAGAHEVLEGEWRPNRVVVVEFPSMAALKGWYGSPEYRPLIAMRRAVATDLLVAVDGI
jgi:uncharacterized protein (DUF1330 family)